MSEQGDEASQNSGDAKHGAPNCCKCGRPVQAGEAGSFGKKSRQAVHKWCVATAKVHYRKLKNPTFKAWWDQKSVHDQTEWYFENGEVARCKKKNFSGEHSAQACLA